MDRFKNGRRRTENKHPDILRRKRKRKNVVLEKQKQFMWDVQGYRPPPHAGEDENLLIFIVKIVLNSLEFCHREGTK